jgi:D-alanyl-D-alanine carboxypeptidase
MASLIGPSLVGIIYLAVSVVLLVLLFWLVHRKKGTLAAVLCTLLALVVLALGYGFGSWYAPVDKDIGSDVYTEAEMDAAVDAIMAESFWDEMHARVLDIHYIGDEQSENYLASVQGRFPDSGYTECAVFNTDFRSAFLAKNAAPLAPREVYTDYQWVLARADGGSWEVVTSGYA